MAHAIVVSAFHMVSRNKPYRELGANYFDEHRRHQLVDRLAQRIERLGYHISLQPVTAARLPISSIVGRESDPKTAKAPCSQPWHLDVLIGPSLAQKESI